MKPRGKIPLIIVLGGLLLWSLGRAREPTGHHDTLSPTTKAKEPVRITMEDLHRHGGTPPGWSFALPAGDAKAGREVFDKYECYACHQIAGEQLPRAVERQPGPDLTGMGEDHPATYFAEAILNQNAVIITEPGFTGADGLSIMPSYTDIMTLQEWIDLVAYLKSLTPKKGHQEAGGL